MEAANRNPNFRDPMGCLEIGGKSHILYKGLNTVGRNKTATVIIRNENVSQQHAMITIVDEDKQFVSDFQSFNGTFLDEQKLLPLQLYKIFDGTKVAFANVTGIFKKHVPTSDNCGDYNKATQNVEESFYTAFTQAVEDAPTTLADTSVFIEPPDCFEDDYNFADVPSPSQNGNIINESVPSKVIDIHEMPTQLYCSDVTNEIEIVADPKVKTKDNDQNEAGTSKGTNIEPNNTGVDIHDLPTQLMCADVQNEIIVDSNKEHIDQSNKENIASSTNTTHDTPTQRVFNNESKLESMKISANTVQTSPLKPELQTTSNKDKTFDDGSFEQTCNSTFSPNVTTDVIQDTILDDSGLDVTSIQDQTSGKSRVVTAQERAISPDSPPDSQSNIHVSQLYRRTLKPIADESEDVDIVDSEVIVDKSKKKSVQPLPQSSSENTDLEIDNQTKDQVSADVSGSDTDIEDLKIIDKRKKAPKNKFQAKKILKKPVSSDSDTEVEELEVESSRIQLRNRKSKKLAVSDKSSGSDTDMDISAATHKPLESLVSNTHTKITDVLTKNSDSSDTDIENIEITTKTINEKKDPATVSKSSNSSNERIEENAVILNNSDDLNDSEVIPPTQDSDEDDDDFNFAPKDHSTVIHKSNAEYNSESVDISQKLLELRNKTVVQQECSEASLRLALSVEEKFNDDETPNICDTDEPVDINTKAAELDANRFSKSEKTIEQQAQEYDSSKNDLDNVFEMQTQQLTETVVGNDDDGVFRKPRERVLLSKKRIDINKKCDDILENNSDDMDALFLQPTQAIAGEGEHPHQSKSKLLDDEDDIFMQSTQALPLHNKSDNARESRVDDEVFLQPTQQITVADAVPDISKCSEDVFNQPTQVITIRDEDIFNEPTQAITVKGSKISANDEEIFNEPTQAITIKDKKIPTKDEDIFNEPTQAISVKGSKISAKDEEIFNEPTQAITIKDKKIPTKDEDIFNEPTQAITVKGSKISAKDEEIFNEPTQVITVNNGEIRITDQESIFIKPTQETETNKMEATPHKNKLSLSSIHKSPETKPKHREIESQLEVMFASQPLHIPSDTNSRPLNPLLNVLEGKRTDSEPSSEELQRAKSPSDDDSESLKEYGVMPTFPLDDLEDFRPQKQKASDKKTKQSKSQKADENVAADKTRKSTRQQKSAPETATMTTVLEETKQKHAEPVGVRKSGRSAKTPAKFRDAAGSQDPPASASKRITEKQAEEKESEVNEPIVPLRGRRNQKLNEIDSESDSNLQESVLKSSKAKKEMPKTRLRGSTTEHNLSSPKKNESKAPSPQASTKKQQTTSNVLVENLTTPRRTRQVKSHEKDDTNTVEIESATNKSTKSKSKAKKSNLKDIQEETESSSCAPVDILPRTAGRKMKKETNKDSDQDAATPKKKAKNAEKETGNTATRITSSRRVKRELSMESDTNTPSKQNKKRKMVESSSESEEINTSAPSTSKKRQQLNVTASSPDRAKRKQKPKVVFTMLDSPELESTIRSLGGSVVDSVETCTVLVTGALKRSQKLLSAVGQAKPICSPKWIKESKKANTFLDPWDFILEDKEAEKKWKFSLKESLKRSSNKKLFEDFVVQIVTTNAVDVLKAAVESCGGKCLSKAPAKNAETQFIVVAASENKAKYSKFLKQKPPVTVVAPEAIFDGVLRQELHLNDHALSL